MEELVAEVWSITKSSLLVSGAVLLGGLIVSCVLASVIVRARILRGHLNRPFSFWRFISKLLLWGSISAVGVTVSASVAAYYATQHILMDSGKVVQAFVEPYVGDMQAQLNALLGQRRGSGYNVNALIADINRKLIVNVPLAEGLIAQVNAEVVGTALAAAGVDINAEIPRELTRIDITNVAGSVVQIVQHKLKSALFIASLPFLVAVKGWLLLLLFWALGDKILSVIARAATRRPPAQAQ